MAFHYISNSIIPSNSANSIHVLNMCYFFSNLEKRVILYFKSKKNISNQDIFLKYGIKNKFSLKKIYYTGISQIDFLIYPILIFLNIKIQRNDIIYTRDIFSFFLFNLFNYNIIFEFHHSFENSYTRILLNFCLKKSLKVVVITNSLKKYLINKYNIDEKKILIAHDAANIDKKLIFPDYQRTISFGYVGSLYTGKGIDLILDIAKKMKKSKFHIIGGTPKQIIFYKTKSPKNVIFYGHVDHSKINNYLKLFDVGLLPNQDEIKVMNSRANISQWTSPLKMFEYMANYKLIVASDLPVLKEVLVHNHNAILCKYNSTSEWVNILENIRKNPLKFKNLVLNSYNLLLNNYTWEIRAKKILNFLKN